MRFAVRTVRVQTRQQMKTTLHQMEATGNMQTSILGPGLTQTVEVTDLLTILEISD